MRTKTRLSHYAFLSASVAGALLLVAAGNGCATDEGDYENPPGFSTQHTQAVALSGGQFARHNERQIFSSGLSARRARRLARGLDPDATLDEPSERQKLETTFHGSYADGMTVAAATHPKATLKVVPVGAQKAPARLRNDGAVIAFEEAFPHVTSAFGGRDSKVEEFLVIHEEKDIPTLAYDLEPGDEFGTLEQDENGRIWAYAADGAGLFTIEPPFADDAVGKRVVGAWKLSAKDGGGYHIEAEIGLKGLAFPVMLDPTFDTPSWFKNTNTTVTPRSASAGTFDLNNKCAVTFGGCRVSGFGGCLLDDNLYVRCSDRKWAVASSSAKPPARNNAVIGYFGGSVKKLYLFGGHNGTVLGDLWEGTLTPTTVGTTTTWSVAWSQIPLSGTYPGRRFMAGMGWDGTRLLMFGGIGGGVGAGYTDTWAFDPTSSTSWTLLDSSSFAAPDGNYGFAYTTIPAATGREIYTSGGYIAPLSSGDYYTNAVQHWNGSYWEDASGDAADLGSTPQGVFSSTGEGAPHPRYGHWMAATGPDRFLMGSGNTVDGSGTIYGYPDAWSWTQSSTQGPYWTRAPNPNNLTFAPGDRSSATAVYDENLKELVLIGGSADSTTGDVLIPQDAQRVYRAQRRSFTLVQSCVDADADSNCDNANVSLKVTFDLSSTGGTIDPLPPACTDMQASFYYKNLLNQWVPFGGMVQATSVAGVCSVVPAAAVPTSASALDYGVRIRDKRYETGTGGTGACTTATTGTVEITAAGARGNCLSGSAYVGSATCGSPVTGMGMSSAPCDYN